MSSGKTQLFARASGQSLTRGTVVCACGVRSSKRSSILCVGVVGFCVVVDGVVGESTSDESVAHSRSSPSSCQSHSSSPCVHD